MLPLLKKTPKSLVSLNFRTFSSPATPLTEDPEFKQFIMEEDLAKNELLKEKLHKFEREWKRLYEDYRQKDYTLKLDMLNEYQKKKVNYLVKQTQNLNLQERQYFAIKIRDHLLKTLGLNPLKLNANWPEFKALDITPFPFSDPNMSKQQEALANMWPLGLPAVAGLFGGIGLGQGGAAPAEAAQQQPKAEAKKEAAKPVEEKKDRNKLEIEMEAFDAAQKIKVIKEVREIFKLGLKEAKELVEKAPVSLKREVPKEEAEKIKEKLVAIGCKINLK